MDVMVSLKDVGLIIIAACIIVFLFYCICFVKNLVVTVKKTNKILEDSQEISGIAAERAKEINESVGDLGDSLKDVAEMMKGNQSTIKALTAVINALVSLKNLIAPKEN